jgi:hypothetical protein
MHGSSHRCDLTGYYLSPCFSEVPEKLFSTVIVTQHALYPEKALLLRDSFPLFS